MQNIGHSYCKGIPLWKWILLFIDGYDVNIIRLIGCFIFYLVIAVGEENNIPGYYFQDDSGKMECGDCSRCFFSALWRDTYSQS